ncbi:MAG: hypothetical protein HRT45_08510 [Bdellovibrionales bacterium]|nr:hypothetical protein [Bdellovibrionales bacterium]
MESLRVFLKYMLALVVIFASVGCGEKETDSNKKSVPSSTYLCSNRGGDVQVTVVMQDYPDDKYLGDLVTTATIETEGLSLEVDLMLAMSFRDNRGVYEIRKALALRDIDGPTANKNIVVVPNADQSPLMMALDIERSELEIVAAPLKRLIRFGLTRVESGRVPPSGRLDEGFVPSDEIPRPGLGRQPLFMSCDKK